MALGIDPTVDFSFKKIFGSPENAVALVGLLNAALTLDRPVQSVEILNPFNYQEFAEQKQVVLDVRCRDSARRAFNVEIQVVVHPSLSERLLYYACGLYLDQLGKGQDFREIAPVMSLGLLRQRLFSDTNEAHHRFRLFDERFGRNLTGTFEVHTVEVTKYNLEEATIGAAPAIQQWAFFLLRAHLYDGETLRRLLGADEFQVAIDVLERIAARKEDRQMYDQRERAKRDYEWILAVTQETARAEGLAAGLEEGREKGLEEGREEGRVKGLEEGVLTGKIQLLQDLLGEPVAATEELVRQDRASLVLLLNQLESRVRARQRLS